MTESAEVEVVTGQDGKEWVHVPDCFLLCLVEREKADGVWHECRAVRIVADEDGTVARLEASNDEEWLTDLGAES